MPLEPKQPVYFELRIIFGAIKAMGLADDFTWGEFLSRFENCKIDGGKTISLLQELFGEDRPILILVDEISKLNNKDLEVITKIGNILEICGFCDVVVSSLSPNYIKDLLSGSQRPIDYAIVYPLLDSGLGKKECEFWADSIISKCGNDVKLDDFKINLLRSVYLLFSGHPRSIEIMKDLLEDKSQDWSEVIEDLKKKKKSFGKLLKCLVDKFDVVNDYADIDKVKISFLEEFLLRHPVTRSAENKDFRVALEKGKISIYNRNGNRFVTFFQLQSILSYISKNNLSPFKTNDKRLGAAYYFLNDIFHSSGVGIIWEKIVSLNIVVRSFERISISDLFGINYEDYEEDEEWNVIIINSQQKRSKKDIISNKFFPPVEEFQPGNDGSVVLNVNKKLLYFYLQMKIKLDISNSKDIMEKVVVMISYNLLEYAQTCVKNSEEVDYNNVYMILYVWGLEIEKFESIFSKTNIPKNDIRKVVDQQFAKIEKKYETLPIGFDKEVINNFINNHWDHLHFVGKDKFQTWLSPSLISFPLLATALE